LIYDRLTAEGTEHHDTIDALSDEQRTFPPSEHFTADALVARHVPRRRMASRHRLKRWAAVPRSSSGGERASSGSLAVIGGSLERVAATAGEQPRAGVLVRAGQASDQPRQEQGALDTAIRPPRSRADAELAS
jgi:hypothetical protein